MLYLRAFVIVAVWLSLVSAVRADPPANFFDIQVGNVPIIITAPHGGNNGDGPSDIEAVRLTDDPDDIIANDVATDDLALKAAGDLFGLLGNQNVYYVVNHISRQYIDLNRAKGAPAYDDPDAAPYWDYYHDTVQSYVDDVINTWGFGLLIDVHGQGQFVNSVYRGTQNGDTVTNMINTFGEAALTGPDSVMGRLETLGYDVEPDNNLPLAGDPETFYTGGFTVQTYGSDNPGGIDSIQLEFGSQLRWSPDPNAWQQSGADLAKAIAAYYDNYLIPEPAAAMLLAIGAVALLRRHPRPQ